MSDCEAIINSLEQRVVNLRGSKDLDRELKQVLRLVYILKHKTDKKKKPPVDKGGILQMSLSL